MPLFGSSDCDPVEQYLNAVGAGAGGVIFTTPSPGRRERQSGRAWPAA
jgi:hypothetical protein